MKLIDFLSDMLFPKHFTCLLCDKEVFEGEDFCEDCKNSIPLNNGATCPVCGRRTKTEEICLECKNSLPVFDKAISPLIYKDGARKLVLRFKRGKAYLKEFFAEKMVKKLSLFDDADALCAVPMTKRAQRRRGYNQAELIAKEISKTTGLPYLKSAVVKNKATSAQKELSRKERAENLKGCFTADRRMVKGKKIVVIDDVLTTGATADAICRELKKKGAEKVYFLTATSVEYQGNLT
ncbi:MAG: ComF family protein [Candidatus Coproplasma sp.]